MDIVTLKLIIKLLISLCGIVSVVVFLFIMLSARIRHYVITVHLHLSLFMAATVFIFVCSVSVLGAMSLTTFLARSVSAWFSGLFGFALGGLSVWYVYHIAELRDRIDEQSIKREAMEHLKSLKEYAQSAAPEELVAILNEYLEAHRQLMQKAGFSLPAWSERLTYREWKAYRICLSILREVELLNVKQENPSIEQEIERIDTYIDKKYGVKRRASVMKPNEK
ncbi:MAG: hypothetical protein C0399_02130 [Syntrophus sp. (in: bacteria)]|nr:hypothetical protein [Syntrophus sp. (in: bacteria)]